MESQVEGRVVDIPGEGIAAHVVQAVEGHLTRVQLEWSGSNHYAFTGFFRSIALRNVDALQDTLRLLTLWFKFGAHDDVSNAMANGFSTVEVDTWLEVIPQVQHSVLSDEPFAQLCSDHCPHPNTARERTA